MPETFYKRFNDYFANVAKILKGEADLSSIFPNTSDKGISREMVFLKFLKQHAPSKCNVFLGGFLFGEDGTESKQLDVIITTDTTPRYNLNFDNGLDKSFGPVEGCLGVASIKSILDKDGLFDSIRGIASIPPTQPLGKRLNPMIKKFDYGNWPYKIVYASNGLEAETIISHIKDFYTLNPEIPLNRRPDIIYVGGKYGIFKVKENGMKIYNLDRSETNFKPGEYVLLKKDPDRQSLIWILDDLQKKASTSSHILFDYGEIINKLNDLNQ